MSVSLNKIGDLKYYDGDLQSARSYYTPALDVRRNAVKELGNASSQVNHYSCFALFQYYFLLEFESIRSVLTR